MILYEMEWIFILFMHVLFCGGMPTIAETITNLYGDFTFLYVDMEISLSFEYFILLLGG